jgi:hypothetical protein
MKKNSTLLLIVVATFTMSFSARAQVINHKGHYQMQSAESEIDSNLPNPDDPKNIKIKVPQNANEGSLVLSGDYKYNNYGQLIEKSSYKFDKIGRQTEKITYILNDYSKTWMQGQDQWICSYLLKRTYDQNDSRIIGAFNTYYEYKSLSMNTGNYSGYKWEQTPCQIPGFNSTYEDYSYNSSTNSWVGSSKTESTYTLNGDILQEEGFSSSWNDTTNTWRSVKTKYNYKYKKNGTSWLVMEYRDYVFQNNNYVLSYEDIRELNLPAKDIYSSVTRVLSNGQLVNSSKTLKTYNIYNRIKQSEIYNWRNDQWILSTKDTYDYTSVDSIRTQTTYRTPEYYYVNGYTLPTLCQGQTMFPYRKSISKTNNLGYTYTSYAYTWTNCGWVPTGGKYNNVIDPSGNKYTSRIYCSSTTATDWTNCSLTTYSYNNKGKQTLYKYVTDGNQYNTKTETEYMSDTIIRKATYSKTTDINGDGVISDTEWVSDGFRMYKYSIGNNTDSLHINTNDANSLLLYDLASIKKLKITGPLSCEDLYEINRYSSDSLEVLDLSDALLENNTLTDSCMGETMLSKLILPKTLKSILQGSIYSGDDEVDDVNPKVLKELVIYSDIERIDNGAFYIMNLERITIPSYYFNRLFSFMSIPGINDVYKSTLKSITFNDKTGKIQDAVCYNLPYLEKATILDGATEIGNNAFKSCGMLKEINFPPTTLRKIGYNAFWGCNELTLLSLPDGLNAIDYSAFWGCSGVTSINMPSSLTNIAQNAFWGCSAVNTMEVASQTPPFLGNNALQGIPREANVVVPEIGFGAYKVAPQWKEFFNMNTELNNTFQTEITISSVNGKLQLSHLPLNAIVRVYTITGAKLLEMNCVSASETIELSKGVYVVQVNVQRFKTIIQ